MQNQILLNSSHLQMAKNLNQANKKAPSTRLQHTPKLRLATGSEASYPYPIVTDARWEKYTGNDRDPTIWDAAPTSPARILLSQVRQYVGLEVDRNGHKPAIMDIILWLISPVQHNEDTLILNDIEGTRRLNQSLCEYERVFKNEESLHTYWAHQAHIAAIQHDTPAPRAKFNISAERSTAGWQATLEGEAGDDERPSD